MRARPLDAKTRAKLRELLEVDPTSPSGLRCKVNRRRAQAGSPAGSLRPNGYWWVGVDYKCYAAHRLIWALVHDEDPGNREIDHVDGMRGNNDPANLRLATDSENKYNAKTPCTNTSGRKGVFRESGQAAWRGRVRVSGKRISKLFSDSKHGGREAALAAAAEWVRAKREKLHGEFARHG